ncbi:MAG: M48 family metallopeptidase [Gloeobacterales cyanobacterium]
MGKRTFTSLTAENFRHPLDKQATQSLQQIPGLDFLLRSTLFPVASQFFHLENLASAIQVGPKQLSRLYSLHKEACSVLDIEVPQLYVRQNPVPNAYTFAVNNRQSFVVIHTSLLELLAEEETQAVIAHELGHLKCEHSVYLTIANLLIMAAGQLPRIGLALERPLKMQLLEWVRCAEFTCDRAALLVAQDPRIVMSLLMKLSGGSPSLMAELDLDSFIDQARHYEESSKDPLGKAIRLAQTIERTHPVPVLRAKEIDRWFQSPGYRKIYEGDYLARSV